jgi:carboxylesterase
MVPKSAGPDVKDAAARADYAGYDTTPVAGVAQVMDLIAHVKDDLAQVRCPILVMHGAEDHTVPLANARQIIDSVSSPTKKLVILEDSYHVISVVRDRLALEAEVLSFVASELAKRAGR